MIIFNVNRLNEHYLLFCNISTKEENMLGVPYFTGHNFETTQHFML